MTVRILTFSNRFYFSFKNPLQHMSEFKFIKFINYFCFKLNQVGWETNIGKFAGNNIITLIITANCYNLTSTYISCSNN